jgi:uncharacterized protein
MTMSLYQGSIPHFVQTLTALSGMLDKAEAYATEKKIDPANILGMRLHPSMWPLSKQVQAACTTGVGAAARLSGKLVPTMDDTEKTFPELKARIAKSLEFIKSVKAAEVDGHEGREIVVKMGPNEVNFKGQNYLFWFALPNFMFHATTAYNILRQSGVELAKRDFLGKNPES